MIVVTIDLWPGGRAPRVVDDPSSDRLAQVLIVNVEAHSTPAANYDVWILRGEQESRMPQLAVNRAPDAQIGPIDRHQDQRHAVYLVAQALSALDEQGIGPTGGGR